MTLVLFAKLTTLFLLQLSCFQKVIIQVLSELRSVSSTSHIIGVWTSSCWRIFVFLFTNVYTQNMNTGPHKHLFRLLFCHLAPLHQRMHFAHTQPQNMVTANYCRDGAEDTLHVCVREFSKQCTLKTNALAQQK